MNAEQKIRIPLRSKLCAVCQRHGYIVGMGQVDIHIVVFCQFLIHGQGSHHGHFLLFGNSLQGSFVVAAVSGIDDNSDPLSRLLCSWRCLNVQGSFKKTGCSKTDRTDHCPD